MDEAFQVRLMRRSGRDNAHELTVLRTLGLELDHAVRLGEQGVVLADADIDASMNLGATLADQDIAGQHFLPPKSLDAKAITF